MDRIKFMADATIHAREQTENAVSRMILAIRERTPAPVIVDFKPNGDINTVQVFHAEGFPNEPIGPFRFVQKAREWCATHPVPGVVV